MSKAPRSLNDTPPLDTEEEKFLKLKFLKFHGQIPPQSELEKMALSLRQTVDKVRRWFADEAACNAQNGKQLQNSVVLPMSPPISPEPDNSMTQTLWNVNQPNPQRPLLMQFYPNSGPRSVTKPQRHDLQQQQHQHKQQW